MTLSSVLIKLSHLLLSKGIELRVSMNMHEVNHNNFALFFDKNSDNLIVLDKKLGIHFKTGFACCQISLLS